MSDALQQDGPAGRLKSEEVGWLTTAGADGQPQSSPIWFVWDGASLWLRSKPTGKVPNIEANPKVAFHLADDGHGGEIVTVEGDASIESETPQELWDAYLAKYGEAIRGALQTTPEQLDVDYPTTIRITPTRTRAW